MADSPPLPPLPPLVRLCLVLTQDDAQPVSMVLQLLEVTEEWVRLKLAVQENGTVAVALASAGSCGSGTVEMPLVGLLAAAEPPGGGVADTATEEPQTQGPTLEQQHSELVQENARLESLVRQYLDSITKASHKTLQHVSGQLMDGAEQRYLLALQQFHRLLGEKAEAAAAAEAALEPEHARLAAATGWARAQRDTLLQFVADVSAASAKAASAGRIKAAVSEAALQHFLATEPAKAAEARVLRAVYARLSHQLASAERRLKAADQLSAEGLHLVDYEQLRIENASRAAKREVRAAEVEKLRGKLAVAVQIAAHVREKLHCAVLERSALESRLAAAESEVQEARAQLTAARARWERAHKEHSELVQDWRIVSDRRCLADMRQQEAALEALTARAAALQAQYEAMGAGG